MQIYDILCEHEFLLNTNHLQRSDLKIKSLSACSHRHLQRLWIFQRVFHGGFETFIVPISFIISNPTPPFFLTLFKLENYLDIPTKSVDVL